MTIVLPENRSLKDGKYTFGIRPENIRMKQEAGDIELPANVILLEPLGAETLVTLSVGKKEMVARFPANFKEKIGTAINVYLNPVDIHIFDLETEKTIFN